MSQSIARHERQYLRLAESLLMRELHDRAHAALVDLHSPFVRHDMGPALEKLNTAQGREDAAREAERILRARGHDLTDLCVSWELGMQGARVRLGPAEDAIKRAVLRVRKGER